MAAPNSLAGLTTGNAIADIESIDEQRLLDASRGVIEAEKQCRIALAADAPKAISLTWNVGGKHGRDTAILLEPGKSVVQPLSKAQVWFGPFAVPLEFRETTDERRKETLRQFWQVEKARYLNRYDYPRPASVSKGGYEPIGPHRSPDVTVTIMEADGSQHPPIRLHELYKIGHWDPIKETFVRQDSLDEVHARYQAEIAKRDADLEAMRRELAQVAGMVKGAMAVATGGAKH
jgi:hypothetical protein